MADINLNDPKYEPAAERMRQNLLVVVTILCTCVGATVVGLRVFTRVQIVRKMYTDDWAMVAAMVFAIGYALEVLIAAKAFNVGFSVTQLSAQEMQGIIKITAAIVITYKMVLTLTKVSILCFYLRLAVRKRFEMLCKYTLGLVVLFQVILTVTTIAQCVPMEKMWDLSGAAEGKCININVFYHFASAFHITLDIWILALPIKLVLGIHRPKNEKWGLFVVFGLGILGILAAIIRLQFLHIFTLSSDPFYDIVPIHVWSMLEVNIGILCVSLPTLRPLFSKAQRERTRAVNGYNMHKRGKSDASVITRGTDFTVRASYSNKHHKGPSMTTSINNRDLESTYNGENLSQTFVVTKMDDEEALLQPAPAHTK